MRDEANQSNAEIVALATVIAPPRRRLGALLRHGTPGDVQLDRLAALAAEINAEAALAQQCWHGGWSGYVQHAIRCGKTLIKAKDAVGYGNWGQWLRQHTKLNQRTAIDWMQLARMSPAESRRVANLPMREALKLLRDRGDLQSVEHFTPSQYIEAARRVFGGTIDLDPASCAEANRVVQATRFFSKADDGLSHDWFGTVFMNSPFWLANQFVDKLLAEFNAGRVTAAVTVLPGGLSIDNSPRLPLWDHHRHVVCFPRERIEFYGPGVRARPIHCLIAYLGDDAAAFDREFKTFGPVYGQRPTWLRDATNAAGTT